MLALVIVLLSAALASVAVLALIPGKSGLNGQSLSDRGIYSQQDARRQVAPIGRR